MAGVTKQQAALNRWALVLSIPLFLGGWEIVSRSGMVNPVLFPPPTLVAIALVGWAREGTMLLDIAMSLSRVIVGFVSGAIAG
ncbi:MAG: ABC transporter permease, partial [Cyanobacteria bacterium J06588_5]